jgi:phage anti-repressor protein
MTFINIFKHDQLGMAVSARELYGLIVESNASRNIFSDWFRHKERKLNLRENVDYVVSSVYLPNTGSNRAQIEFIVTLRAAKLLAGLATKRRGAGVISFIDEYERTGQLPTKSPDSPPISQPAFMETPMLTSQYKQPTRLEFDRVLPELQKLGSQSVAPAVTETDEEANLSPAQRFLRQAQQMVEEENRLKAEQEEQAKKVAAVQPDSVALLDARLVAIEQKQSSMLSFFQQAYQSIQAIVQTDAEPVAEEIPQAPPTTRSLLIRLVNSFAAAERRTEHEVWKYLYGHFDLRKGFNVYAHAPAGKERNYLSVIEQQGHLESLYDLAQKLLVLPALK